LKRLLSLCFLAAVWVYGAPALAADNHDAAMKSAVKLHDGANILKDGATTYVVTVKGNKLVSVKQQSMGHSLMAAAPIKVTTTTKSVTKGVAAGYGCVYRYYCWYDVYGRYYCAYQYVCA